MRHILYIQFLTVGTIEQEDLFVHADIEIFMYTLTPSL